MTTPLDIYKKWATSNPFKRLAVTLKLLSLLLQDLSISNYSRSLSLIIHGLCDEATISNYSISFQETWCESAEAKPVGFLVVFRAAPARKNSAARLTYTPGQSSNLGVLLSPANAGQGAP